LNARSQGLVGGPPGDFFYLFIPNERHLALADAPPDQDLGKRIRAGGWIADWKILNFQLGPGLASDYLANSFAFRLCSDRLRNVLEEARGSVDMIQWLPARVWERNGPELVYWVLHFPVVTPVTSASKTKMAGPVIVKAVLDANLVEGHRIFSFPNDSVSLVLARHVKEAIEKSGCTGTEFSKLPIA